jgi:hypothetical protein
MIITINTKRNKSAIKITDTTNTVQTNIIQTNKLVHIINRDKKNKRIQNTIQNMEKEEMDKGFVIGIIIITKIHPLIINIQNIHHHQGSITNRMKDINSIRNHISQEVIINIRVIVIIGITIREAIINLINNQVNNPFIIEIKSFINRKSNKIDKEVEINSIMKNKEKIGVISLVSIELIPIINQELILIMTEDKINIHPEKKINHIKRN